MHQHYISDKTYLDQLPDLDTIVSEFLDSLDPDFKEGFERDIESIDCRRRDGFIPHSHNHGGYDKEWITDLSIINGSGYEVGSITTEKAGEIYEQARESYISEHKDELAHIPADKLNYHDLHDLKECELDFWIETINHSNMDRADTAERLKDYYTNNSPEVTGVYADLLTSALQSVDYYEIAESLIETAKEYRDNE